MADHWTVYRPSPRSSQALPIGARSAGRYAIPAPCGLDDLPARGFSQLYWIESGRLRFGTAGPPVEAGPGEVFAYRPDHPHRIDVIAAPAAYWWFTWDGPLAAPVLDGFGLVPPWPRRAGPPPEPLLRRLARLLRDPGPAAERTAAALAWELLTAASAGGPAPAAGDDAVVERLRRALVDRAADPDLSVVGLAAELGIDRSLLTRRFAAVVGLAPKPYLQSLRLGRAMALLHGSAEPVAAVARACGFADPGYFARTFRVHTGLAPEAFRRGG